jgi:hypothetical protein
MLHLFYFQPVYACSAEWAASGAGEWGAVWSIEAYEPDPVVAYSFGNSI